MRIALFNESQLNNDDFKKYKTQNTKLILPCENIINPKEELSFTYFSINDVNDYFSQEWDVTIIVNDISLFFTIPLKGLLYFKINKLREIRIDVNFLYNIVFNMNLQGIMCVSETETYMLHDSPSLKFLKSRRNKNGNCLVFPLNEENLLFRFKSDIFNKNNSSNIFYHAISENVPLKTFVINLEKRVDRKKEMVKKCDYMLHDLEFVNAINGYEIDATNSDFIPEVLRSSEHYFLKKKNPYGGILKPGEIGCIFSHIKVWKLIISLVDQCTCDEKQIFCVFEDDVIFLDRYFQKLMKLISQLSVTPDWKFCFLGHHDDIPGIDKLSPEMFDENVSLVRFNGHAKRTHGSGAFSYLCNYSGAKKMMECVYKYGVCQAIDWFMFEMFDEVECYKTYPHLITTEFYSTDSNIQI